ncbi:MAG: RNA polymerase sigma factor [Phycisphaerales bacterium]
MHASSPAPTDAAPVNPAPLGSPGVLDREGFAQEFERVADALWCIAAGVTGDRSGADDIVQQSAVIALEHLGRFDPSTSLLAWMGAIVRNAAMNELRKQRRRRTMSTDPERLDQGSMAKERSWSPAVNGLGQLAPGQEAFDDRVLAALGRLDPIARACLLLRVVVEAPYRQIALLLGIPEGTAMSHVDRSRRRLREHLRDRFGDGAPDRAVDAANRDARMDVGDEAASKVGGEGRIDAGIVDEGTGEPG